jgi:hypothetical protein
VPHPNVADIIQSHPDSMSCDVRVGILTSSPGAPGNSALAYLSTVTVAPVTSPALQRVRENSNFVDVVEQESEVCSREAAKECSPRRKPWGKVGNRYAPTGRKKTSHAHTSALGKAQKAIQVPEGRPTIARRFSAGNNLHNAVTVSQQSISTTA